MTQNLDKNFNKVILNKLIAACIELKKGTAFKSLSVLVGGASFAQAITVISLPAITRIYTPDDLGLLAVFSSIVGVVAVAACLRFDVAVAIPENDAEAINLLGLALSTAFIVSMVSGAVIYSNPSFITSLIGQPKLEPFYPLIPLGIFLAASFSALQYWNTRKKKYSSIALAQIAQASMGGATQIGFGFFSNSLTGLFLGQIISNGSGVLILLNNFVVKGKALIKRISIREMKSTFRKYDSYPKFSTLDALANNAAAQIPIIIIASVTLGSEVGFLILAIKSMQIPMAFIGSAVSQYYLSNAPNHYRNGSLNNFTEKVILGLFHTGVGPLLFIGILAPVTFDLLFGVGWERAGELVLWMTPWFILQYIASPISMIVYVKNAQKLMLGLTVLGFFIRLAAIELSFLFYPYNVSEFYAVAGGVFYLLCFVVFMSLSGINRRSMMTSVSRSAHIVGVWIAAAILIRYIIAEFK